MPNNLEQKVETSILAAWILYILFALSAWIYFCVNAFAADNINVSSGSGNVVAYDEVTRNSVLEKQVVAKIGLGAEGAHDGFARMGQQTMANSMACVLPSDQDLPFDYAEDTAHSDAAKGLLALAVRNDGGSALAGTTGDYIPFTTDSSGALRVTGGGGGTEYTEGDTDASITGSALLWEDTSDTLRAVSASKPLPIDITDASLACTQSGTWNVTNISGTVSLPTGAATLAEQQTQTTSLQLLDDAIVTEDAASVGGEKIVLMGAVRNSAYASKTSADGDYGTLSVDAQGYLGVAARFDASLPTGSATIGQVGLAPRSSGGVSKYRNIDLDETGVSVKASAGQLYGWYVCNQATSTRYLKIYNSSSAPTVGTDTPFMTMPIPAGGCANESVENGIELNTGLGVGCVTGVADNSTGAPSANDCVVNIFYK